MDEAVGLRKLRVFEVCDFPGGKCANTQTCNLRRRQ